MHLIPKSLRGKGFKRKLNPNYWSIHPKFWVKVQRPKVVYLIGMPRTGSTLMKRYLGDYPSHLYIAGFGEYKAAWQLAKNNAQGKIVIDKKTGNMPQVEAIYQEFGNRVWFAGIVRDPRDELLSLLETDRHPEIPRDYTFWQYWYNRYQSFLKLAAIHSQNGYRCCFLRYEDLVRQPELVKQDFLTWLNIQPAEKLSRYYTGINQNMAIGIDISEDWKVHQTNVVHEDSMERWKKVDQIDLFELLNSYKGIPDVLNFMKGLGYGDPLGEITATYPGVTLLGMNRSS